MPPRCHPASGVLPPPGCSLLGTSHGGLQRGRRTCRALSGGQEHVGVGYPPGAWGPYFCPLVPEVLSPLLLPHRPASPAQGLAGDQTRVLVLSLLLVKSPRSRAAAGRRRARLISLSALIAAIAPCKGKVQAGEEAGGAPWKSPRFAGRSSTCSPGEKGNSGEGQILTRRKEEMLLVAVLSSLGVYPNPLFWRECPSPSHHPSPSQCLVVGAGPCGLRVAIELALLGARVVLLEKRDSFSRNNVLHLWPFTIHDLRALGAKKFYGRFCTGTLDHISEFFGGRLSSSPPGSPHNGEPRDGGGAGLSVPSARYPAAPADPVEGGSAPGGGGAHQRAVQGPCPPRGQGGRTG